MIQIYIVSLISSIVRRDKIASRLFDLGIKNYLFFDAIKADSRFEHSELNQGEIGCALSHLDIYKRIIHNNIPYLFILEDDINIDNELYRIIENTETFLKENIDVDIVMLGYSTDAVNYKNSIRLSFRKRKKWDNRLIGKPVQRFYGTYSYFITNTGARKIVNLHNELIYPSDIYLNYLITKNIQLFCIEKPIVFPGLENNSSTIGERTNKFFKNDNFIDFGYKNRYVLFLLRKFQFLFFFIRQIKNSNSNYFQIK
jgi:glycosyl transferase family 25